MIAEKIRRIVIIAAAALLLLVLTACNRQQVVRSTHVRVVQPDASMYNCPTIEQWPDATTLTDVQVARLLVQLYQNNEQCAASLAAIRTLLERAAAVTDDSGGIVAPTGNMAGEQNTDVVGERNTRTPGV